MAGKNGMVFPTHKKITGGFSSEPCLMTPEASHFFMVGTHVHVKLIWITKKHAVKPVILTGAFYVGLLDGLLDGLLGVAGMIITSDEMDH